MFKVTYHLDDYGIIFDGKTLFLNQGINTIQIPSHEISGFSYWISEISSAAYRFDCEEQEKSEEESESKKEILFNFPSSG